jgi:1,4-alpha-glucan branching enzyme
MDATACWFDPFMYQSQAYARYGRVDSHLLRILDANRDFAPGKLPVTYIENHDHSTLVNEAGGRHRWYKTQPAAIALLTSPGLVMLHNGQEFGEDYWLPHEGAERVQARPLRWENFSDDFIGQRLISIYQKLITIRKEHPALRSPNYFPAENHPHGYGIIDDQVVVFHRYGQDKNGRFQRFIIVINYSDHHKTIDIPFSNNGLWQDLLNEKADFVQNYRLNYQKIPSNWGRIYFQSE